MAGPDRNKLKKFDIPTPVRLSLLWASLMGLYIYNDYFSMYRPGTIEDMTAGRIGPFGEASPTVFIVLALILAIPALMIFLSAVLRPAFSRWSNIILGLAYTIIEGLTFFGAAPFYQMVVVFEVIVTLLIVWIAWHWPRTA
jgi:hypothetical protein